MTRNGTGEGAPATTRGGGTAPGAHRRATDGWRGIRLGGAGAGRERRVAAEARGIGGVDLARGGSGEPAAGFAGPAAREERERAARGEVARSGLLAAAAG